MILVPRERAAGETRVAATPETVGKYCSHGFEVVVEAGAGSGSHFTDASYTEVGAKLVDGDDTSGAWESADMVLAVTCPALEQIAKLHSGSVVVGFMAPHRNLDQVRALAAGRVSVLAMELIPRISAAQAMDALSSQASIAGYKAVLLAATALDKYFPLLMTAAGTIKPARVVVMGAGVAGLQAIATARRLGAIVDVSDIRAQVREQVESLGGRFIELPDMGESGEGTGGYARQVSAEFLRRQQEIVATYVAKADAVITTALVPGKRAPMLVTEPMVAAMRPGAVIVDMAVEQGGNCALSVKDQDVVRHGVLILGPSNLPATMPRDASSLYARNVYALLESLRQEDKIVLNTEDEITAGTLLVHDGTVCHEPVAANRADGEASSTAVPAADSASAVSS